MKKYQQSIETLLQFACPSIQYRVRLEILGQSPGDQALQHQQRLIPEDDLVRNVFKWQQPDGWLGRDFHGFESIEAGIRILAEKGLQQEHPVFSRALHALEVYDDRLHLGIGKVGRIMDDLGFGGSQRIRATVFAYAGVEDKSFVKSSIASALESFRYVLDVQSITAITEKFGDRLVFKPRALWPDVYALRLLAFTHSWRSPSNVRLMRQAIQKLVDLSPIPNIYIRHKSQWVAPGSFAMHNFNPDLTTLDDASWMLWFHRMEMLARLGVVRLNPTLCAQVNVLEGVLDQGNGMFTKPLSHYYYNTWGAYSGLRLERDWRSPKRRTYDLTFRSLLILHNVDKPISL